MAWYIRVLEIADARGRPTGKFRKTAKSDESGGPIGLCDHEHGTREGADACEDARAAARKF
jgi:hypothetical protein